MTEVRFHPEARSELRAAVQLYQEQARDRGRALVMEVGATIDRIKDLPRSGTPHHAGLRRAVLSRFPFSLVYRLVEGDIEIIAVMHHRRRPGYWRDRS